MNKRIVTPYDLDVIFSNAKDNFVNNSIGHLEERQFRTKCMFEAILSYLHIQDVEFEQRQLNESLDD